jgi:hypothetical protein
MRNPRIERVWRRAGVLGCRASCASVNDTCSVYSDCTDSRNYAGANGYAAASYSHSPYDWSDGSDDF